MSRSNLGLLNNGQIEAERLKQDISGMDCNTRIATEMEVKVEWLPPTMDKLWNFAEGREAIREYNEPVL